MTKKGLMYELARDNVMFNNKLCLAKVYTVHNIMLMTFLNKTNCHYEVTRLFGKFSENIKILNWAHRYECNGLIRLSSHTHNSNLLQKGLNKS